MADTALRRPGGRTARVRDVVLRAALVELREHGYAGITIDNVAYRSGITKATIYRRWGGRDRLILDAVESFGAAQANIPDTGRFDRDLTLWARSIQRMLADPATSPLVRAVVATDPQSNHALRQQFWRTRLQLARPIVDRAVARGECPADTDAEEVIRHLGAPLYYRILVLDEPVTRAAADLAAKITIDAAMNGLFRSRRSRSTVNGG